MIVYKKVRLLKDGNCYPLFIDNKKPFKFGKWMKCEYHPTNGFAPRTIKGDPANGTACGGWHCCFKPVAPHIADSLKSGEHRVWIECESKGKSIKYNRPESQGGTWVLVEYIKPLRILTTDEVNKINL